jgi:endonuclease YncB( thermonuclease family)
MAKLVGSKLVGSSQVKAREYPAGVVEVLDGDTVRMLIDLGGKTYAEWDVRLRGVYCPERGKPGGPEATAFTREWLAGHVDDAGWFKVTTYKAGAKAWKPGDVEARTFVRYVGDVEAWTGGNLARAIVAAGHGTEQPLTARMRDAGTTRKATA